MMKNRHSVLFLSSTLVCGLAVSAFGAVGEAQRIERLEMLADIWGKLYLFHPRIVTSNVDWSQVLVETIPKVERASDTDELIAILNILNNSLFRPLDDQLTSAQNIRSA